MQETQTPSGANRRNDRQAAPEDRLQRLNATLRADGRKLRALEMLLSVRHAQVVALDSQPCSKLVGVVTDLDRIMQRAQRSAYRQMNHELIAANRKVEDELARAAEALAEHAALLGTVADVDTQYLLDPVVRRRVKEMTAAKAAANADIAGIVEGDGAGETKPKRRARA